MNPIATTLIALTLIASTPALAGTYSHAVARSEWCGAVGTVSSDAFDLKAEGKPKQNLIDKVKHILDGSRSDAIIMYAINYGYDKAISKDDAHMTAWGYCMDNTSR